MHWVQTRRGFDLVVLPLHGRGNRGGEGAGVKILRYRTPEDRRGQWETEQIDDSLHMTHNFDLVQWRGRRSEELLVGGKEGLFHFTRGRDGWSKRQLAGAAQGSKGAGEIRGGNLEGGGRFVAAIEPMHGSDLAVYTPPAAGADSDQPWTRHLVDDSLVDGHALACGDMIGAGSDQIVAGWRAMNRANARVGIRLYTPKNAQGTEWSSMLVDDNTMACEDLKIADLNGDGRLDIVACGRATKNVKIYWNEPAR